MEDLTQEDFQSVVDHLRRKVQKGFDTYAEWAKHAPGCLSCNTVLPMVKKIFDGDPLNASGSLLDVVSEIVEVANDRGFEVDLERDVSVTALVMSLLQALENGGGSADQGGEVKVIFI